MESKIAKFKEQRAGGFHDFLRGRVGRLIHAAFITREAQHAGDPRKTRREFCAPQNFIRVAAVRRSPHVGDIERRADFFRLHFLSEKPAQQIVINRKILQPDDGVAMRLQIGFDLVPDSRVHVIRAGEHEHARFPLARAPGQDLSRFVARLFD